MPPILHRRDAIGTPWQGRRFGVGAAQTFVDFESTPSPAKAEDTKLVSLLSLPKASTVC